MLTMARRYFFIVLGMASSLLLSSCAVQRGKDAFFQVSARADTHYSNQDYTSAAKLYSDCIWLAQHNRDAMFSGYFAALCWSMQNEIDSAFTYLTLIGQRFEFYDSEMPVQEPGFTPLKADKRWPETMAMFAANFQRREARINKELRNKLEAAYDRDVQIRLKGDSIDRLFGRNSHESKQMWLHISEVDSLNIIAIDDVLAKHGWPSADEVGDKANSAVWLIIQHSSIEKQEKYLPLMKKAVAQGHASAGELALLKDRMAVLHGKKQHYGTQLRFNEASGQFYFLPIKREKKVNARRASVGLPPIEHYAQSFGFEYKLKAKKR